VPPETNLQHLRRYQASHHGEKNVEASWTLAPNAERPHKVEVDRGFKSGNQQIPGGRRVEVAATTRWKPDPTGRRGGQIVAAKCPNGRGGAYKEEVNRTFPKTGSGWRMERRAAGRSGMG
jgi:hypothetical protein